MLMVYNLLERENSRVKALSRQLFTVKVYVRSVSEVIHMQWHE